MVGDGNGVTGTHRLTQKHGGGRKRKKKPGRWVVVGPLMLERGRSYCRKYVFLEKKGISQFI